MLPNDPSSRRDIPETPGRGSFARILLLKQVGQALDYGIPESFSARIKPGMRVTVPFRNRRLVGIVGELSGQSSVAGTRPVIELLDEHPVVDLHLLDLTRAVSDYYLSGWGTALRTALPPGLDKSETILFRLTGSGREALDGDHLPKTQEAVLRALSRSSAAGLTSGGLSRRLRIRSAARVLEALVGKGWIERHPRRSRSRRAPKPNLVNPAGSPPQRGLPFGFESVKVRPESFKEGYRVFCVSGILPERSASQVAEAVEAFVPGDAQCLVLAPEVSVAEALAREIAGLLDRPVALYHGDLSPTVRKATWDCISAGRASVVVGTRSAVFAPLPSPGLIVIIQEEDSSYKAEEAPYYHAREVALMRARMLGIPVVLTSVAPSVETQAKAMAGEYRALDRGIRPRHPAVVIEDIHSLKFGQIMSPRLAEAVDARLQRKKPVLLLLNRRGYSTAMLCRDCGHIFRCEHCGVTLIFHRHLHRLVCHYCGSRLSPPTDCPSCKGTRLGGIGTGTEQVEDSLRIRYPGSRILRVDRDTGPASRKKADIYIGTEWIYRWAALPPVHLVAVLDADTYLHVPDFHASERTFHFISLVVAKARPGPSNRQPAEVIIQTRFPEHFSIRWARDGDTGVFYDAELFERKSLGYPPYSRLIAITVSSGDSDSASGKSRALAARLVTLAEKRKIQVMGPVPAPVARLRGKYRSLLLLKGPTDPGAFQTPLAEILGPESLLRRGDGEIRVVVDPVRIH